MVGRRGGHRRANSAIFIDGYTYIYRYANHVPLNETLHTAPQLFGRDLYVHKGLDLQGGTEIVLEIDPRSLPSGVKLADAQNSTVQVMDKRANGIGVSEAAVQAQGDRRVVVQLPGVGVDRARQVIGKTAKLTFRIWQKADATQLGADGKLHLPNDATGDPIVDPAYVPVQEGGTCTGSATIECIPPGYVPKEIGVDGSMITSAVTGADTSTPTSPTSSSRSTTRAPTSSARSPPTCPPRPRRRTSWRSSSTTR